MMASIKGVDRDIDKNIQSCPVLKDPQDLEPPSLGSFCVFSPTHSGLY
jgi:hypothetical protein